MLFPWGDKYNYKGMLNNLPPAQKQKNELVFKLLKSMNPYMPDLSDNASARQQLYSIIQSEAAKIIVEEGNEEEASFDQGRDRGAKDGMIRRIVSRVVDVRVQGGRWGEDARREMEELLRIELEGKRQSIAVRKEIENIKNSVYRQFKIPYQHNTHNSQPNSYRSQPPSSNSSTPFLPTMSILTSRSSYIEQSPRFESPIKSYRHETDRAKSSHLRPYQSVRGDREDPGEERMELGLESRIGLASSGVRRSKSMMTVSMKTHKKVPQRSKLSVKPTSMPNPNPKSPFLIKASQKLIKQAQKLDIQIMSSILHKKLRYADKSNTIASLIK